MSGGMRKNEASEAHLGTPRQVIVDDMAMGLDSSQGAPHSLALAFRQCQSFQSLTSIEPALLAGLKALSRRLLLDRAAPAQGQVCSCELHQPSLRVLSSSRSIYMRSPNFVSKGGYVGDRKISRIFGLKQLLLDSP